MRKKKNKDYLERAWESRRTYYEYNGIRDSRTGWTKRLGLTANGFGNRLKLYKEGKISKDLLFRPSSPEPSKRVHTKYELKITREQLSKCRRDALRKYWENVEKCPTNHTIRVWENVFKALREIKPANICWSQFFISKFKLNIQIPKAAKFSDSHNEN